MRSHTTANVEYSVSATAELDKRRCFCLAAEEAAFLLGKWDRQTPAQEAVSMNMYSYKSREDGHFSTSSFYAAAFLSAKGLQLIDIDRANPNRCQFVFRDTPEREELLRIFNFAKEGSPEAKIDARKFVVAVKTLKDALYQGGNND